MMPTAAHAPSSCTTHRWARCTIATPSPHLYPCALRTPTNARIHASPTSPFTRSTRPSSKATCLRERLRAAPLPPRQRKTQ